MLSIDQLPKVNSTHIFNRKRGRVRIITNRSPMTLPQKRIDTLVIAGEKFLIERVINIDVLIDQIDAQSFRNDERMPYWAELWPSAVALSEYILEHQAEFKGKHVLELGSGLGLAGIAATRAGAEVLFSDYEQESLDMIRVNFKRNFKRVPSVSLIDWREVTEDYLFDMIIASDVLYEQRWLEPVNLLLNQYLLRNGFAVIAEPGRTVAQPFFATMLDQGWLDEIQDRSVFLDQKKSAVRIHRLQKC